MSPVSELGAVGYAIFWGVTILAGGIFGFRLYELLRYLSLGNEESCCGDPARRAGNEYLFQMQAERNIETLKQYGIKKIVTACPHCFNTLKNEYPQFGAVFEVRHHTQFISDLLSQGKLRLVSDGRG